MNLAEALRDSIHSHEILGDIGRVSENIPVVYTEQRRQASSTKISKSDAVKGGASLTTNQS